MLIWFVLIEDAYRALERQHRPADQRHSFAPICVGGSFSRVGGGSPSEKAAHNIACRFSGQWTALGDANGEGTNSAVKALAITTSGVIYAGGAFTTANGVTVNHVGRWSGGAWSDLNGGLTGAVGGTSTVNALALEVGNHLLVGGAFTTAGGTHPSQYFARWYYYQMAWP